MRMTNEQLEALKSRINAHKALLLFDTLNADITALFKEIDLLRWQEDQTNKSEVPSEHAHYVEPEGTAWMQ